MKLLCLACMPTPNKNNNKTVRKEYKKEIMKRTAGSYFRGSDMESRVGEKVRKFSSSLPLEQLGDLYLQLSLSPIRNTSQFGQAKNNVVNIFN